MKKRIMICLTTVMTVLFSILFLTACKSLDDDNNQADNSSIRKELSVNECSSELSGAISASVAKDNYSIKIVGSQDEGRSFVANIKYDANAQHVILNSTQDYLGVTTRQYSETYLFTRNGKYYSSKITSENDSLPNPSELGKTEFDELDPHTRLFIYE